MSSYNCPEYPELDLKDAAVRRSKRVKKRQFTDKQEMNLEKGTKNNNWADIEVKEEKEEHKTQAGKFKCDQCSYATIRICHLDNHKIARHKSDEDIEWYKCPKCPKKLKLKGLLKQHLRRAHEEVKKWFTCTHCPFKTKIKLSLTNHEITHHAPSESIKRFHCTQCHDYKARTKTLLQQHVRRKHGQFFRCDYCPYSSKDRSMLRSHEITKHEDCIKWIKCDKCGKKFKDEAGLRCHNNRIHKTGEVNERQGAMPITSTVDISNGYSCSVCMFKTLDRVAFDKHIHKTQPDQIHLKKRKNNKNWADIEVKEEEENHETETGKFKCDQCSYAANRNYHLNRHKIVCHKSDEDIEWYKCPKCPKKLKIKYHLQQHLQSAHDEVKKWFICAHCPFKTKKKAYLTNHEIARHTPTDSIKWFHCTQCDDYKGKTKALLQCHMKQKHGQFFMCDYCPYRSKGKTALKTHEITEHQDCIKWSKCDECGQKFKNEAGLRSHSRIHKTDEFNESLGTADASKEYLCSVCQFQTLDRVEFDKHSHDIKPKIE